MTERTVIRQHTKEWLIKRCVESGTQWNTLGIEFGQEFDPDQLLDSGQPVHLISVLFGGSFDESFHMLADEAAAIKVARWVAEDCQRESESAGDNPHEDWSVIVEFIDRTGEGSTVYRQNGGD